MSDATSQSSADDAEEIHKESRAQQDESPMDSPDEAGASPSEQTGRVPAPKRRRVTRACDECRRKKIKCDGKQPCTHCTVYSYDCTYDQPSQRRRNPGPQYIEALEHRLHRAEALLRMFAPDLDMNEANLDRMVQQGQTAHFNARSSQFTGSQRRSQQGDASLESMVKATGQLDLDARGYWDYHGHSSGLSFIRGVSDQIGKLPGPEQAESGAPYVKSIILAGGKEPFDSSRIHVEAASEMGNIGTEELPPREIARQLCSYALDDATTILICVHQPTFYNSFNRIYDLDSSRFENQDHKFLPLLYTVLALGCLFAKDEKSDLEVKGYASATNEGYKYFWAARQLTDIADCRDLVSLQAIAFMILFLQCSAKLSTCYAYIGVALRSALRMGLHRSFNDSFNPIESETRKRIFWVIRKMDIHVGAMLGLPKTLSDDDIDQDYPTEVDDEYITVDGILPMPAGKTACTAAANANFRLNLVISKIVRNIYPIKDFGDSKDDQSKTYSVGYTTIRDIEGDLQHWLETLPRAFQPGQRGDVRTQRAQQLLRMAYAHAQLMLYRPFLHYVSARSSSTSKPVDQRSFACAAACVGVSRNIIHITSEMNRRGLLVGSYWFVMYTTFFGILSLVFFAIENPENASSQDVIQDAEEGKKTLAALAKRSMAADRCTQTLTTLFNHYYQILDDRERRSSQSSQSAPPPASSSRGIPNQFKVESRPSPDGVKRASTFPKQSTQSLGNSRRPKKIDTKRPSSTSQQAQSSTSSNYLAMRSMTSESPHSAGFQPYVSQGQQYGASQQSPVDMGQQPYPSFQHDGKLSDYSSIMFPSQDPFAYPHPMMTTLEERRSRDDKGNVFDPSTYSQGYGVPSATGPAAPVPGSDQIDVQLFGPLPPYLHAPHPHERIAGLGSGQGRPSMGQEQTPSQSGSMDMWSEQQRSAGLPGMNLDDIFGGEEWRGFAPDQGQR